MLLVAYNDNHLLKTGVERTPETSCTSNVSQIVDNIKHNINLVRFRVLTASMKMTVFWDVAPCSLIEIYRRYRDAYCLHQQGDGHPDDRGSKHL
jgi:hypothetical protein